MSIRKTRNFLEACEAQGGETEPLHEVVDIPRARCKLGGNDYKYFPEDDVLTMESRHENLEIQEPTFGKGMGEIRIEDSDFDVTYKQDEVPTHVRNADQLMEELCERARATFGADMVECNVPLGEIRIGEGRHPTDLMIDKEDYLVIAGGDFPVEDFSSIIDMACIGDYKCGEDGDPDCKVEGVHHHDGKYHPHVICDVEDEDKFRNLSRIFEIMKEDPIEDYREL